MYDWSVKLDLELFFRAEVFEFVQKQWFCGYYGYVPHL